MESVRASRNLAERLRFGLVLLLSFVAVLGVALPVAADEAPPPQTELQRLMDVAMSQVGARYSFASAGPNTFDCSGFVTYVYKEAGLLDRIGGKRRTVAGFRDWFRSRGWASSENRQPGDLIVWGKNKHLGIYIGDGMAISALINPYGVRVHKVTGYIGMKVRTYLHVNLER